MVLTAAIKGEPRTLHGYMRASQQYFNQVHQLLQDVDTLHSFNTIQDS